MNWRTSWRYRESRFSSKRKLGVSHHSEWAPASASTHEPSRSGSAAFMNETPNVPHYLQRGGAEWLHFIGVNERAQARTAEGEFTEEQASFVNVCSALSMRYDQRLLLRKIVRRRCKAQSSQHRKGIADETGIAHRFCDQPKPSGRRSDTEMVRWRSASGTAAYLC
jgi:hypothetical protein